MHGRVVGELGGDERVVSSVCNGRVTMEEDTVSLGSYLPILANSTYVYLMLCTTTRLLHGIADQPTCS